MNPGATPRARALHALALFAAVLLLAFFFANVEIQIEGRTAGPPACRPGGSRTIGCSTSSGAAGP